MCRLRALSRKGLRKHNTYVKTSYGPEVFWPRRMPASYLKIGGELLEEALLSSVEVEDELNRHMWCRIECRQTLDRRFPFESFLGKTLEIVAVDQQGGSNPLFSGFVLDSEMEYEI